MNVIGAIQYNSEVQFIKNTANEAEDYRVLHICERDNRILNNIKPRNCSVTISCSR